MKAKLQKIDKLKKKKHFSLFFGVFLNFLEKCISLNYDQLMYL